MSRRQGVRGEQISEGSDQRASLQAGEPSSSPGGERSQQTLISPDMDPYMAFQMGLEMGRVLASAAGERTAEGKPQAEQDLVTHLHGDTDQCQSGSTSPSGNEDAKPDQSKRRRSSSSTDQSSARKSRSPKKAQSVPDLDPGLKFHMAMNLMGEKNAREYLIWFFMDEQTGQLPPGSEEQIEFILQRTLGRKRSELVESQVV